jgi:hypothetical protein
VQWRGVVSPKERSNNPTIICVNFHELNFNSLPLQMGRGSQMHNLFKIPPQKRRKDSSKSNQIGPQNANKMFYKKNERLMGKWDKGTIYYSIKQFFLTYLAGGCVLFHGFTPPKVGSHKS